MIRRWSLVLVVMMLPPVAAADGRRFGVEDLDRLIDVSEPALSPDGEVVAYTATTANVEADVPQSRKRAKKPKPIRMP